MPGLKRELAGTPQPRMLVRALQPVRLVHTLRFLRPSQYSDYKSCLFFAARYLLSHG